MNQQRPWLLTALRGTERITVGQFDTVAAANGAASYQMIDSLPRVELNPEFAGAFPLSIHIDYTRAGVRGMALKQYNIHSRCEQWVSQIFCGPFAFRDCALLRNEIEAGLAVGVAS